jgi:hypothetical protein
VGSSRLGLAAFARATRDVYDIKWDFADRVMYATPLMQRSNGFARAKQECGGIGNKT